MSTISCSSWPIGEDSERIEILPGFYRSYRHEPNINYSCNCASKPTITHKNPLDRRHWRRLSHRRMTLPEWSHGNVGFSLQIPDFQSKFQTRLFPKKLFALRTGRRWKSFILKTRNIGALFALILKEMEGVLVSSLQWNMSDVPASSSTGWDEPERLKGLFTCLACQIGFHTADLQRQHYRTDWYSHP